MPDSMSDRYRLVALRNEQLLAALAKLVLGENDLLSDLLAHLAELDERRLYLELGFTSLFAYCTEALGLCKSSAYRRIAAARVCRRYPEAFERVAAGELQVSVLAALSRYLSSENSLELFATCSRKSCEQVEELLAARFPKPDVPDSMRRLPARAEGPRLHDSSSSMGNLAEAAALTNTGLGAEESKRLAADPLRTRVAPTPVPRKLEPLSAARFGVHFTADTEFKDLLDELRALTSHRRPDGDLLTLLKRGLEAYRRELQKDRFGVGRTEHRARRVTASSFAPVTEFASRSRHVPAAVACEVYLRDSGRCTFSAANGQRCGAKRFVELDHIEPWAVGGEATPRELAPPLSSPQSTGGTRVFRHRPRADGDRPRAVEPCDLSQSAARYARQRS